MAGVTCRQVGKRGMAAVRWPALDLKWSATQWSAMVTEMPEQEDDQERRAEKPYASGAGEGAGEGVVVAREGPITIEQYEGATTWGDLNDISLRKLAEGLVRIERRVAAIEERMVTKEDLAGMATKQDLEQAVAIMDDRMVTSQDLEGMATKQDLEAMATKQDLEGMATKQDLEAMATKQDLEAMVTKQDLNDAMMTILRWNVSLILAGIAIMAGVTFGILQIVIANLPQ